MQGNSIVRQVPSAAGFGAYTIVDVETSGLRASGHRVLSVAALALDADGRVAREFHTLLDPGCDPGPVHVHGLTAEILRGSPRFEHVREPLSALLAGRVMVAHNAQFDYGFLAREFGRTGADLPVDRRLCTLALARRVAPPTPNCKLDTLAAYYGVPRSKAHDVLDDTRVLAGVLRALVADAARLGITPPLLRCPPKENYQSTWGLPTERTGPKAPCPYVYPGRLETGGTLVQGMKVAFTGDTATDRDTLVSSAEAAGLEVTSAVSGRTSVLVTNAPDSSTGKARKAIEVGTPIVGESRFLLLLERVEPGRRKDEQSRRPAPRLVRTARVPGGPAGPLAQHRVLVLGGSHDHAVTARARIVELGGSAAVNMSARVTDVLLLAGGHADRRYAKAAELGLPVHGADLLSAERPPAELSTTRHDAAEPVPLRRGQVMDLPVDEYGADWTIRASWAQNGSWMVDLVAFLVDGAEQVTGDEDFVFYNQPETGGVRLSADGPDEQSIALRLDQLPGHIRRIVLAVALDGANVTFGDVGALEFEVTPGVEASVVARATLDAATEERTLVLAEIYLRGDVWRLRAVGQGHPTDLATLALGYGVEVEE
ncbi:TerD family protein [Nocardia sp. NBC_01730]|uniref:TerD family protein n=1 Tax=Nocardia sp. NBC_01730 TaxID=2975998 RepID=UPI002E0E3920|nr:TerD family protein [Nocardia sp. NBC_01730]